MATDFSSKLAGTLLGTAVGDSLGLPREGLSRRRAERLFGGKPLRQSLFFGRGMVSDDTEQTCLVAQSLLVSQGRGKHFVKHLSWGLRWWLMRLPAGVGLATLKAILKLWIGFPPSSSGVYSAGNGSAMRSAIIGACLCDDFEHVVEITKLSSEITHSDSRATEGAIAVALAAAVALKNENLCDSDEVLQVIKSHVNGSELIEYLEVIGELLAQKAHPSELAERMGLQKGVSGYVNHTVPVSLFCWLRYIGDFRASVEGVVLLGGDTDTTGAITGALSGTSVGVYGIPEEWINTIVDWPLSTSWIRHLAMAMAEVFIQDVNNKTRPPITIFWPGQVLRNIVFLVLVLGHGLRRILPPY